MNVNEPKTLGKHHFCTDDDILVATENAPLVIFDAGNVLLFNWTQVLSRNEAKKINVRQLHPMPFLFKLTGISEVLGYTSGHLLNLHKTNSNNWFPTTF